jgi:hypothetical protein
LYKKNINFKSFHQEMVDATKVATSYLPSVTTLRIIHHKLPWFQLISQDIISDRIVVLPDGIAWTDVDWDDDGFTDVDVQEQSDNDLFENSGSESGPSSTANGAP